METEKKAEEAERMKEEARRRAQEEERLKRDEAKSMEVGEGQPGAKEGENIHIDRPENSGGNIIHIAQFNYLAYRAWTHILKLIILNISSIEKSYFSLNK